ncbi:uncharacterized protein F4822DRAFT_435510 [Hypoxylon trugodes]|uniref:uncharacterized protein n=1 Tax=Hypoxylon trugodes TaxID=326681 RepID=UPI00219A6F8A|nr:uncharacterized protein F4822DRAFT_435510 [Hypoxylon trugodes]KAI1382508.1 hypothetical protein F4822DRAFT_435510 [Hypoxylon trugodes]
MVPFGRNENLVGRESILQQLLERIPPSTKKDDCQQTALEGLGSKVSEASARPRSPSRPPTKSLGVKGIEDDKADAKMFVKAALSHKSAGSWLLVIDNADDLKLFADATLSDYLLFNWNGSILFTTRNYSIVSNLDISFEGLINIGEMS